MHETTTARLQSVWLELTGHCQLACHHCYADSGPQGSHGTMTVADWITVIDNVEDMGCELVQLIGGEPTLHPHFTMIATHALENGLDIEVATNLVHVTTEMWDLFQHDGVSLAVSYYGADAATHAAVTGTKGSHARTRANLAKAVSLDIAVRGNVIHVNDDQDIDAAVADLHDIGVMDVGIDDVRGVGRGTQQTADNGMASLCGDCGNRKLAVLPNGDVTPCVIGRHHVVGNLRTQSLADIANSAAMKDTVRAIKQATAQACYCSPDCTPSMPCSPDAGEYTNDLDNTPSGHQCGPESGCGPQRPSGCGPNEPMLVAPGMAPQACKPKKPCGPDGICQPSSGDCRPTRRCKPSK